MAIHPFVGFNLKVRRAERHYVEYQAMWDEYVNQTGRRYVPSADGQWVLELTQDPPDVLSLVFGDLVHNLRSALDLLICDIARLRQKESLVPLLAFPIGRTEAVTRAMPATVRLRELGADIEELALSCRPYGGLGGDSRLHALHTLDIQDKHRVMVPPAAFLSIVETGAILEELKAMRMPSEPRKPVVLISFEEMNTGADRKKVNAARNAYGVEPEVIVKNKLERLMIRPGEPFKTVGNLIPDQQYPLEGATLYPYFRHDEPDFVVSRGRSIYELIEDFQDAVIECGQRFGKKLGVWDVMSENRAPFGPKAPSEHPYAWRRRLAEQFHAARAKERPSSETTDTDAK